jgi:signal transduction histidine kinase
MTEEGNIRKEDDLEKAKKELITMISHLIRTPLTIIKEGLSVVLDEIPGKLNPEQKKFLIKAKDSTDRLIQSVEKILQTPWDEIIKPSKN